MGEAYPKLVRDKIPEIIQADGQVAEIRILNPEEYKHALLTKLVEEAKELLESNGDLEELADVEEVRWALLTTLGYTAEQLERARVEKFKKRGGFEKKILLEGIHES